MSFFGPGGTGRNIAGLLGDVLLQQTGNQPVYAPAVKQRQQMLFEEQQRQRTRMEGREDKRWERDNLKDPYVPDDEKKAQYYESIGDYDTAKDIRDRVGLVQTQKVDPVTLEVRTVYVRPGLLADDGGAAPTNLPRVSSLSDAAKLPPGSSFIAPDGSRRKVPGGAAPSNGPGMFPRPY